MKGLFDFAKWVTGEHAKNLQADPSLAAELDADPNKVMTEGERLANAWERRQKVVDLERVRQKMLDDGMEP